jgi:hypothetical protein
LTLVKFTESFDSINSIAESDGTGAVHEASNDAKNHIKNLRWFRRSPRRCRSNIDYALRELLEKLASCQNETVVHLLSARSEPSSPPGLFRRPIATDKLVAFAGTSTTWVRLMPPGIVAPTLASPSGQVCAEGASQIDMYLLNAESEMGGKSQIDEK